MAEVESKTPVREGYKQTEIGEIPESWEVRGLGEVAEFLSGFPFKSSYFTDVDEAGMPLIRIRNLVSGSVETYYSGPPEPDYLIRSGDVLVGMDGDFPVHRWRGPNAFLNQRVCRVSAASVKRANETYLFYALLPLIASLNAQIGGTTVKHLSIGKHLQKLPFSLPPLPEQQAIAGVLESVDDSIRAEEERLTQLETLKRGLMQDLLTGKVRVKVS